MKFKIGQLDADLSQPDDNWKNIKSMSTVEFQKKSILTGLFATIIIGLLWSLIFPVSSFIQNIRFPDTVIIFATCLVGTLIIHEFLHLAAHPIKGNKGDSIIGFWPSRMFLYAQYKGKMTRTRSCVILLMPFTIISMFPLLISSITMKTVYWIAYISIVNAFLSSGDLYLTIKTLRYLPKGSTVKFGWWINNK